MKIEVENEYGGRWRWFGHGIFAVSVGFGYDKAMPLRPWPQMQREPGKHKLTFTLCGLCVIFIAKGDQR